MIAGIDMGAALTSTALSLTAATSQNGTYRSVYDSSGNAISWTVAGNRFLKFDPPLLGYPWIKLVAGSNEGSARTLTLVLVP